MKKQIVISLLLIGTVATASTQTVSADVISNTNGLVINKNISVKPTYTLIVGQLSTDDWRIDVTETDNSSNNSNNSSDNIKEEEDHGVTLTPVSGYQKVSQIVLTDQGVRKVTELTGVKDSSNMNIVATLKSADRQYTGSMIEGDNVTVESPVVYVTKTMQDKKLFSNRLVSDEISTTKLIQKNEQSKLPRLSDIEQETVSNSNVPLTTGVDVSTKYLSTKKINQKSASDQKNVQKALIAENKLKTKQKLWQAAGYVLIVVAGFITGTTIYKVRSKLKNKR